MVPFLSFIPYYQAVALMALTLPPATDSPLPVAEVRTVAREYSSVDLLGIAAHTGLTIRSGNDIITVPLSDVVRITFSSPRQTRKEPPAPGSIRWSLTGGDRLIGSVVSADEGAVVVEDRQLGSIPVPLEAIAGLEVAPAAAHQKSAAWFARMPAGEDDLVLLTNGDVLRGFLLEITSDGLIWDTEAGPSTIPYRLIVSAKLAGLAAPASVQRSEPQAQRSELRPQRSEPRPPGSGPSEPRPAGSDELPRPLAKGAEGNQGGSQKRRVGPIDNRSGSSAGTIDNPPVLRAIADLTANSRITLSDFRVADGVAAGRTSFGAGVSFDAKALAAIEVQGGRWEWLSDWEPASVTQVPMLSLSWAWRRNANVLGGPLTVAKAAYDRGLGVHGKCTLAYDLDSQYAEFVTLFGLDDSAGPLADVNVSILVDGQEKFSKTGVRAGELHGPVRIDLSAAHRLELLVDFGQNGDIQDRFNWLEPGLVRQAD